MDLPGKPARRRWAIAKLYGKTVASEQRPTGLELGAASGQKAYGPSDLEHEAVQRLPGDGTIAPGGASLRSARPASLGHELAHLAAPDALRPRARCTVLLAATGVTENQGTVLEATGEGSVARLTGSTGATGPCWPRASRRP